MKALVLKGINDYEVQELQKPQIDADSALVRVRACAICGSDLRIFQHGNSRVTYPVVPGHEIAGEIVEVGANVTRFKVGDRVATGGDIPCGACVFCEAGMGNNCKINYALGYQFQGGFAEYMPLNRLAIDYGPVHLLPDHVSFDEGALAEPLACILNGFERSPIHLGDCVVIIGAGPIGCIMTQVARIMGATKIILVEYSPERLDYAKTMVEADVFINSKNEDAVAGVLAHTEGMGADVLMVACSSPEAQQMAFKMANSRAYINIFGGIKADSGVEMVGLDVNLIHYKELMVTGSHGATPMLHKKAVDLIASGRIDVKRFITSRYPLAEFRAAFEESMSHKGMRVVVNP